MFWDRHGENRLEMWKLEIMQSTPELVGRVQRSRNAQKRWALCKVLVIDEISMMEADLFDKLNIVAQRWACSAFVCRMKTSHAAPLDLSLCPLTTLRCPLAIPRSTSATS